MTETKPIKSIIYEFGEYTIDLGLLELKKLDQVVNIQRKALDLLIYLIENRTRAVGKEELQDHVWPGTIVTEAALTRAIMKARRAINDDADNQKAIQTRHGHGYRFIAYIEVISEEISEHTELSRRSALRRRQLLRVATAYGAIAWLVNQIAAMVWEAFELPKLGLQTLLAITVIGFPIVLAISWVYQPTDQGLKRRDEIRTPSANPSILRDRSIMAILAIALGISVFWNLRPIEEPATAIPIAMLPIENLTGDADHAWIELGLMSFANRAFDDARLYPVDARAVLNTLGSHESEVTDELLIKFKERHGVQHLIKCRYQLVDDKPTITTTLYSGTEVISIQEFSSIEATDAIRDMAYAVARRINPALKRQRDAALISADPFVDQAYARGMHELLSGKLQNAQALFKAASVEDAKNFWPSYEYAYVSRLLGETKESIALLLKLLDAADVNQDARHQLVLLNAIGIHYDLEGQNDEAEKYLTRGLELAATEKSYKDFANISVNLAILENRRAHRQSAQHHLEAGITAYKKAGIEIIPPEVYNTLGNVHLSNSELASAEQAYQRTLTNAEATENLRLQGIALNNISLIKREQGKFSEALQLSERSLTIREEIGDVLGVLWVKTGLALLQQLTGQLDVAQTTISEILASPDTESSARLSAVAIAGQGNIAFAKQNNELAEESFRKAISAFESIEEHRLRLATTASLLQVLLNTNAMDEFTQQNQNLLTEANQRDLPAIAIRSLLLSGSLAEKEKHHNQAVELYQFALKRVQNLTEASLELKVRLALAQVYLSQKKLREAVAVLTSFDKNRATSPQLVFVEAQIALAEGRSDWAKRLEKQARGIFGQNWHDKHSDRLVEISELFAGAVIEI